MSAKCTTTLLAFGLVVTCAIADLELGVDTEYPRQLDLRIPVQEDSDFHISTSFGKDEFFTATRHVGRITGVRTNRNVDLSYGYTYSLGGSKGSATGSQSEPLTNSSTNIYSLRVVSSLWAANPRFVIREVPAPVSPAARLTNMIPITNISTSLPK